MRRDECLQSETHMNHKKINITEIKPFEQELEILSNLIGEYRIEFKKLVKEKEIKIKQLNDELKEEKIKGNNLLNDVINLYRTKNMEETKQNTQKYLMDIIEIKKKYEEEMRKRKKMYEESNNKINNKYKLKNWTEKIKYIIKIKKLNKLYESKIEGFQFEAKLKKCDNIIKMLEIAFKSYSLYDNNYYNSINIGNILVSCIRNKSSNEKFKKILGKDYDTIIKMINRYDDKINLLKKGKKDLESLIKQEAIKEKKYNETNGEIKKKNEKNKFNLYLENNKLLENIKYNSTLDVVFSYLDEKRKLESIKYNKNLQNKLNIKLINYKFLSGRFIIFETKAKGREYSGKYNYLEFEGEYSKGKRNGKGQEYHSNGELKFEGEYLEGKRIGKGHEYHLNGELKFEGEYLNGKRIGKGREYDEYGKLKFEGEYLNGERNGKGKEYEYGNLRFEGKYLNGERNGIGKEFYDGYLVFDGEYLNGKRFAGKEYDESGKLCFNLKASDKSIKEYDYFGNLVFEGDKNGKGKEFYYNGKIKFEGEYLNRKKNGKGKEYNYDGYLIFEGEYTNGKKNGKGKEYDDNGILKFEGEYINGKRSGKGKEYDGDKHLIFEGEFFFDKKWKGKGYDELNNFIYELTEGKGFIKNFILIKI